MPLFYEGFATDTTIQSAIQPPRTESAPRTGRVGDPVILVWPFSGALVRAMVSSETIEEPPRKNAENRGGKRMRRGSDSTRHPVDRMRYPA